MLAASSSSPRSLLAWPYLQKPGCPPPLVSSSPQMCCSLVLAPSPVTCSYNALSPLQLRMQCDLHSTISACLWQQCSIQHATCKQHSSALEPGCYPVVFCAGVKVRNRCGHGAKTPFLKAYLAFLSLAASTFASSGGRSPTWSNLQHSSIPLRTEVILTWVGGWMGCSEQEGNSAIRGSALQSSAGPDHVCAMHGLRSQGLPHQPPELF